MMRDDFCAFILTHGRPDRVHTYDTMMKAGYTGKVYIVIDDEDRQAEGYRQRFGDKVLQFNKAEWAAKTDEGDNFQHRKAIVYARNACWDLAKQVGCRYFVQFDDDYTDFSIRISGDRRFVTASLQKGICKVLSSMLEFYIQCGCQALAMSQAGDWIGGAGKNRELIDQKQVLRRKCMNSWFCDAEKPIRFFGHMNEDVSAYVTYGHRGELFFTVMQAMLVQKPTQVTPGGMSDLYLSSGTYVKSFYTVMANPSCVQIGTMGDPPGSVTSRIHHKINWHKAVPKIIDEKHKK
jgi:hypothetical protein